MNDWFQALGALERVFVTCAVVGGGLFGVRLGLLLLGGGLIDAEGSDLGGLEVEFGSEGADAGLAADVEGADAPAELGDSDAELGAGEDGAADAAATDLAELDLPLLEFKALSLLGITAFLTMFGLVGLALLRETGTSQAVALLGGTLAGGFAVWLVGRLFALTRLIHSSGTVGTARALGAAGTVYLGIPGGGTGQVQVVVAERLRVYDAVTDDDGALPTGTPIRVIDFQDGDVLVVTRDELL